VDEVRVVVYGSNAVTRRRVIDAVGSRPSPGLPPLSYVEIATPAALLVGLQVGGIELVVLDGEAAPAGGLGMARQLRDELESCPPVVVLLARPADRWLAKWSGADASVRWPSDPLELSAVVVQTLWTRIGPLVG
jgi:DNA-binding response OmpR family regulator